VDVYRQIYNVGFAVYNFLISFRIVLDNFRNPDVSYVVDFLSTHVVATILLALLFMSKVYDSIVQYNL
jgi:hypothetical protein